MKQNILKKCIGVILFAGAGFAACSDDDLMTYEDVSRIYFAYADSDGKNEEASADSRVVNMGYDIPLKEDSIIRIPIKMMGRTAETVREVKAMLISEESTAVEGKDIEIVSASLEANSVVGNVVVKLNRTEQVEKKMLMARIRLASNEHFHTDYSESRYDKDGNRNGLIFTLYFTALADKPSLWAASTSSQMLQSYFGTYSNAKMTLLYEACGLTREDFEIDPADNDPSGRTTLDKRFPSEFVFGLISMINRYLADYKAVHGEPMLDEFGQELKTGLPSII